MIETTGNIELVEELWSWIDFGIFWVVSDYIFKCIQELVSVHKFHFSQDLTDDILELIINNGDSLTISGMGKNLSSNSCSSWEVEWCGDMGDSMFQNIWEGSWESNWPFITDDEYFVGISINFDQSLNLSDDTWVSTTT